MDEKSKTDKEFAKIRVKKGAIVITDWDFAFYTVKHDDIAIICIDCQSKYFDAYNDNDLENKSYLVLTSNECTLKLNPDVDKDDNPEVYFEDHLDWQIKFTSTGRYTAEVCLVKRDDQ